MENVATTETKTEKMEPRLRHEFVGMMFAITIGEVGLQFAALIKGEHFLRDFPAFTHLLVATAMIAASWVGWSVSKTRGARLDVTEIFQWEFLVLLLDVSMVITYFILVRSFEYGTDPTAPPRIDNPSRLAFWIAIIFALYIAWDFVTKVLISQKLPDSTWWQKYGRMFPTFGCLIIVWIVWKIIQTADPPHYPAADFALFCLAFLFRASKDFVSAVTKKPRDKGKVKSSTIWTVVCLAGLTVGTLATKYSWDWVIPDHVAQPQDPSTPASEGKAP